MLTRCIIYAQTYSIPSPKAIESPSPPEGSAGWASPNGAEDYRWVEVGWDRNPHTG